MSTTRTLGTVWWEWLTHCNTADLPLIFKGQGLEKTAPWRFGPCVVVRVPFTRFGLAVGLWEGRAPVETDEDGVRLAFRDLEGEERDNALGQE